MTDRSTKVDQNFSANSSGDKVKIPRMKAPRNIEAIKLFLETINNMARLMKKPIHARSGDIMVPLRFWRPSNMGCR